MVNMRIHLHQVLLTARPNATQHRWVTSEIWSCICLYTQPNQRPFSGVRAIAWPHILDNSKPARLQD